MAEKNIAAQTVRAQADSDIDFSKVKRNDLCPCGSGKNSKIAMVVNNFKSR